MRKPVDDDGEEIVIEGDERRFMVGRDGDHLMTPFQCEKCHFRNIFKRDPNPDRPKDRRSVIAMRRASLDAFWAREPKTVVSNLADVRMLEETAEDTYGFPDGVCEEMGPFPLKDTVGMKLAMTMLQRSLDPGRTEERIQFSTMRRMRTGFANVYGASHRMDGPAVMAHENRKVFWTDCPSYGLWFDRMMNGCHKRMGDRIKRDHALSIDILLELLKRLERDWNRAQHGSKEQRYSVAEFGLLLCQGYCVGLRGEEIVKTMATGLRKWHEAGRLNTNNPHVCFPLRGRMKGETGERNHLLVAPYKTVSGINVGLWMSRLLECFTEMGRAETGYLYADSKRKVRAIGEYNPQFIERLEEVYLDRADLFPP